MSSSSHEDAHRIARRAAGPTLLLPLALIVSACASSHNRPSVAAPAARDSLRRASAATVPQRCAALGDSADSARANADIRHDELAPARIGGTPRSREYPGYDVVLDVPVVCVDRLALKVDTLKTKLALDTRVANLVRVNAGADIVMDNVDVNVTGVHAKALLLIDLTRVVNIVDQTLALVDGHPELVPGIRGANYDTTPSAARSSSGPRLLLLGSTRTADGRSVQRLVSLEDGSIIERTFDASGALPLDRHIGNVVDLPPVWLGLTSGPRKRVRDPSGAVLSFVQNSFGAIRDLLVEADPVRVAGQP